MRGFKQRNDVMCFMITLGAVWKAVLRKQEYWQEGQLGGFCVIPAVVDVSGPDRESHSVDVRRSTLALF